MFDFTPLNILFIVLSIGVFLITIFLCMALYHVIQVLRDVEDTVEKANVIVDKVNTYIAAPIRVMMEITNRLKQVSEFVQKKAQKKRKKKEE